MCPRPKRASKRSARRCLFLLLSLLFLFIGYLPTSFGAPFLHPPLPISRSPFPPHSSPLLPTTSLTRAHPFPLPPLSPVPDADPNRPRNSVRLQQPWCSSAPPPAPQAGHARHAPGCAWARRGRVGRGRVGQGREGRGRVGRGCGGETPRVHRRASRAVCEVPGGAQGRLLAAGARQRLQGALELVPGAGSWVWEMLGRPGGMYVCVRVRVCQEMPRRPRRCVCVCVCVCACACVCMHGALRQEMPTTLAGVP